MEFTVTNKLMVDSYPLEIFGSIDVEVGGSNSFEFTLAKTNSIDYELGYGCWIYSEGTEFGGRFEFKQSTTNEDEVLWSGTTFRGFMEQDIVVPQGNYRTISGEANSIIRTILSENNSSGILYTVPEVDSGITFTNYQFPRYWNKLKCLKQMLATQNHKLQISVFRGGIGVPFIVQCEAVPIVDFSTSLEFSQDNRVNLTISENRGGVNHLICLGDGELSARLRVDLYILKNGTIKQVNVSSGGVAPSGRYTGIDEKIAVYPYSSVEGETTAEKTKNLAQSGLERLAELSGGKSVTIEPSEESTDEYDLRIGDIIGAKDFESGISASEPIEKVIFKSENNQESITVEVGTETEDEEIIE